MTGRRGRATAILLIWVLATAVGLLVARLTKVGQVVWIFVPEHGVHTGDVVAFAVCYSAALVATLNLLR